MAVSESRRSILLAAQLGSQQSIQFNRRPSEQFQQAPNITTGDPSKQFYQAPKQPFQPITKSFNKIRRTSYKTKQNISYKTKIIPRNLKFFLIPTSFISNQKFSLLWKIQNRSMTFYYSLKKKQNRSVTIFSSTEKFRTEPELFFSSLRTFRTDVEFFSSLEKFRIEV
jgi:hypothetical protein